MHTIVCLYHLSGDKRLLGVISKLAAANMDPNRYYGPPNRAPHNHGVLANEALRQAGELFKQSYWVERANERDRELLRVMFEDCGMMGEQSSSYQVLNIRLWQRLITPSSLQYSIIAKAREALGALMRPDGDIEYIGDGFAGRYSREELASYATPGGNIMCPRNGWAAMHLEGAQPSQHVLRFGPSMRRHGHADHGALTWWVGGADGVAVLVDRGNYTKAATRRNAWAHSEEAHSTLTTENGQLQGRSQAVRYLRDGEVSYTVGTESPRGQWTRTIAFDRNSFTLDVRDQAPSNVENGTMTQRWQLGPTWITDARHTAASGNYTIDVSCTVNGRTREAKLNTVEHYSGEGQVVQALEVSCTVRPGETISTRLQVRQRA